MSRTTRLLTLLQVLRNGVFLPPLMLNADETEAIVAYCRA